MKKVLLLLAMAGVLSTASGQGLTVTGTVTSFEDGTTLPGVNILIKGKAVGTVTDLDGNYSLSVPSQDDILVFSLVGYVTEELPVAGQSKIDMIMIYDIMRLNEIVVVGYGQQKKKDISSALTSINTEQMENAPTYSFEGALQGLSSGVNISSPSATPGAAISVNIRGTTSISASSQPLYIIDGIPVVTGNNSALNANIQPTNPLADINPADIESITVLKDASAVAIYGSRGANGVILINTKRGESGKAQINLNYYYGISEIANTPEMMTADQWVEFLNVAAENDGLGENYWSDIIGEPGTLTTYDVYDEIFRSAPTHNVDLSASGGNDKTQFYMSGNYFSQEGVQLGQGFERFSGRMNLDHQVNDKVSIGGTFYYGVGKHQRTINENDEYGVIVNAQAWDPTAPLYNGDGSYTNPFDYFGWWALENPTLIAQEYVNESLSNRIQSMAFIDWEILAGLTFRSSLAIDFSSLTEESFIPAGYNQTNDGLATFATYQETNLINENTLSWSKLVDKHDFNVLGGFTWQNNDVLYSQIDGQGFTVNDKYKLTNAATITYGESSGSSFGLVSYLLRFNYGYDNRYLVSLTGRMDGSSRFGENERFGSFPSASVAWNAHNESFLKESTWLNQLKFRTSYGIIGNQEIGNETWTGKWSLRSPYNGQSGIRPQSLANPDLTWEETAQLNVGVDMTMLESRVSLTADYFDKQTERLLLQSNIPGNSGFTTITSNAGTIQNKGYELTLSTVNVLKKDFKWMSSINYTDLTNEVIDVINDGEILGRNFILKEGEPLSSLYLIRFLGVDPTTGDAKFQDLNSDGLIDLDDRQIVGSGLPTYFGGFNNELSYKGFNLQFMFYFSGGNQIFNQSRYAYENYGAFAPNVTIPYGNYNTHSLDYWRQPGDITDVPRPSHARLGEEGAQSSRFSTQYMEDGDFIRLRTVKLSYSFGKEVLERLKLRSLVVYGTGQNLFTWTNYLGFDPEINTNTASLESLNTLKGEDFGTLGQARTFILGINVGF